MLGPSKGAGLWTKALRDRLGALTRLGVPDDMPPHEAKHIILTNTISIVAVALSVVYLLPNTLAPLPLALKIEPGRFRDRLHGAALAESPPTLSVGHRFAVRVRRCQPDRFRFYLRKRRGKPVLLFTDHQRHLPRLPRPLLQVGGSLSPAPRSFPFLLYWFLETASSRSSCSSRRPSRPTSCSRSCPPRS